MREKRALPINRRVSLIIVISLLIGIGGITTYLALNLSSTIERSTEQGLIQESDLISNAIKNFMLPGQASLAISYFRDFNIDPTGTQNYSIGLFRRNGVTAFSDDQTVMTVNSNIDKPDRFESNSEPLPFPMEIEQDSFASANGSSGVPGIVIFSEVAEEQTFLRIYNPLINEARCWNCHGNDHSVRGIIDIRKDITSSVEAQQQALIVSGGLFLGVVLILALWLTNFLRAAVLLPVQKISRICSAVTNGEFDQQVEVKRNDEIGRLGETVNTMVKGLHERYELSRYVSSSTIESIQSGREGRRVTLTMFFSDIRNFTAYSEGSDAETVVKNLNEILNMQTEHIHKLHGDIDKYVGDEIVAMFTETDAALNACKAALRIQHLLSRTDEYEGLKVGIGIHTGEVILGSVGSTQRADFTVIGDTVNAASRLCDVAREGQILISEQTWLLVKDLVQVDGPYRLKVKGKEIHMIVYFLKEMLDERED